MRSMQLTQAAGRAQIDLAVLGRPLPYPGAMFDLTDSTALDSGAMPLHWPVTAGSTSTVRSDLGWWLQETGPVPDAAIDLARVASGAYLADRLTARPASFTRIMELTVAVTDPDR